MSFFFFHFVSRNYTVENACPTFVGVYLLIEELFVVV